MPDTQYATKYKLLAMDVDGTLIGPDQKIPEETVAAVEQAQRAGVHICLATGRSFRETYEIWRQLRLTAPYQPMVLVGGAQLCDPQTGQTLMSRDIPRDLTLEFGEAVLRAGYSTLALVDAWRWEFDYRMIVGPDEQRVQQDWLSKLDYKCRRVNWPDSDGEMLEPLRMHALIGSQDAEKIERQFQEQFDGKLYVHAIHAPNYEVTILEAFHKDANKWTGLMHLSDSLGIKPEEIVAVGDDVNDTHMLAGAGLGAAMPNGTDRAKAAADVVLDTSLGRFITESVLTPA